MKCTQLLVGVIVLAAFSCTSKKNNEAPAGATAESKNSPGATCADGSSPKVLEGAVCPSAWGVQKDAVSGKNICVLNYGPSITCPEGTKSLSYEAVCYGQVSMSGFSPQSAEECAKKHEGAIPPSPYRLMCCPK